MMIHKNKNWKKRQYKSTISDKVCTEWIDLVHNQIPTQFWQNLDSKGKLKEEARWKSVRDFADNCVKRRAFENAYRKERGMKEREADILTKLHLEKGKGM
jgi:hypothetical protein